MIKVALILHASRSRNLGVGALTVAQVDLLRETARKIGTPIHITLLDWHDTGVSCVAGGDLTIVPLSRRDFLRPAGVWAHLRAADLVLDIGAGDSFSDIYGPKRLRRVFFLKYLTHLAQRPLVLSPQTFGPFNKFSSRVLARLSIALSTLVFARDETSVSHLRKIGVRRAVGIGSDVALRLPTSKCDLMPCRPAVGINVSGLLMSGGYNRDNQFGLDCHYPTLIRQMILHFLTHPDRPEVHLIPHVISPDMPVEDDHAAIMTLRKDYPQTIAAPAFKTPSQVKGYIAKMSFFTGARMHACIAAFSSGVAVVPMAYSRKFAGLFEALGYDHVADCRTHTGETILNRVLQGYEDRVGLSAQATTAAAIGRQRLAGYEDALEQLMLQIKAAQENPAAQSNTARLVNSS
ncbi:polysaccharide pyruvyl transferase family protein [Litoreibacter sp.]|nr:polysaccharide pyruvyl transferase family protein [Litoreibacter sp.]